MKLHRSLRPAVALGGLLAIGVVVRVIVGWQFTVPWISPDEMLYGLLGESLWSDGAMTIRGAPAPYYSLLTPALVGAGLVGRPVSQGVHSRAGPPDDRDDVRGDSRVPLGATARHELVGARRSGDHRGRARCSCTGACS